MTLRAEWNAISARISGLSAATQLFIACTRKNEDAFRIAEKQLYPEAKSLYQAIEGFRERYLTSLPKTAKYATKRFLYQNEEHVQQHSLFLQRAMALATALVTLDSQLEYCLADFTEQARRITERAFVHLQRSIVADLDVREKWNKAFKTGETRCEKLGAVHLLSHGIWAFKADAEKEYTDLVMGEPPDLAEVERAADALVLTEWKCVKSDGQVQTQARKARQQAALYASGSLAGIELAAYRYLVLVSKHRIEVPSDCQDGAETYRHINVAVDPKPPSRSRIPSTAK